MNMIAMLNDFLVDTSPLTALLFALIFVGGSALLVYVSVSIAWLKPEMALGERLSWHFPLLLIGTIAAAFPAIQVYKNSGLDLVQYEPGRVAAEIERSIKGGCSAALSNLIDDVQAEVRVRRRDFNQFVAANNECELENQKALIARALQGEQVGHSSAMDDMARVMTDELMKLLKAAPKS